MSAAHRPVSLLPQLTQLTLAETVEHVARVHRRRTALPLDVTVAGVPEQAPTVTKIALYRVIQEALTNGWRHAGGANQAITVTGGGPDRETLRIEITDSGPGFDPGAIDPGGERLGLIGMRERVESLGGEFRIESHMIRPSNPKGSGAAVTATGTPEAPTGTRVVAILPVHPAGERDDGDG